MLKSLRNNLRPEHRLFRVLTSTVGEIFMVMVGILLALQVNNWNTDRADRVKEVKWKAIRDELTAKVGGDEKLKAMRSTLDDLRTFQGEKVMRTVLLK